MEPRIRSRRKVSSQPVPSWSSLVASTLGLDDFGRLRVVVSASISTLKICRLVVQSYAPSAMTGNRPGLYARPLAAAQRAISAEELEQGVALLLFQTDDAPTREGCVVLAWLEAGHPDLDYDGLCARPTDASYFGTTHARGERAEIVLRPAASLVSLVVG